MYYAKGDNLRVKLIGRFISQCTKETGKDDNMFEASTPQLDSTPESMHTNASPQSD